MKSIAVTKNTGASETKTRRSTDHFAFVSLMLVLLRIGFVEGFIENNLSKRDALVLQNGREQRSLIGSQLSSPQKHGALSSSPDDNLLDEILKVAMDASQKAALIIQENSDGSAVVETKSTSRDLLTVIDPQCEKVIRETIQAAFPDHHILGEEGVEPGVEAAKAALEELLALGGFLWICDPIDGTTNFASGIPFSAPSLAVAYDGELLVGVIHDPHREEVWTAVRGKGAFLNGEPIVVPRGSIDIKDAVIGAESPAGQKSLEAAMIGIQVLMPQCRTIRILGSTAVKMPWVAKGRLTCYWSPDECAWDHAAGAIIVQEAGGILTDLDGSQFTLRTRKFLASQNQQVHDEVIRILKEEAGIDKLL